MIHFLQAASKSDESDAESKALAADLQAVQTLIAAKADLNTPNSEGWVSFRFIYPAI